MLYSLGLARTGPARKAGTFGIATIGKGMKVVSLHAPERIRTSDLRFRE